MQLQAEFETSTNSITDEYWKAQDAVEDMQVKARRMLRRREQEIVRNPRLDGREKYEAIQKLRAEFEKRVHPDDELSQMTGGGLNRVVRQLLLM